MGAKEALEANLKRRAEDKAKKAKVGAGGAG